MSNYKYKIPKYPSSTYYMSVREVFEQTKYLEPRDYRTQSRYNNLRRLVDDETNKIYHESTYKYNFISTTADRFYTVNLISKNRLDVISNEVYGSPNNWWVISMCNDVIDPFNVPAGTVLRIPPLTTLYENGGVFD